MRSQPRCVEEDAAERAVNHERGGQQESSTRGDGQVAWEGMSVRGRGIGDEEEFRLTNGGCRRALLTKHRREGWEDAGSTGL